MGISIRQWRLSDAKDLAAALSNQKVLNNLRDGSPYPYTDQDAQDYIRAVLSADPDQTFAMRSVWMTKWWAASVHSGRKLFIGARRSWVITWQKPIGDRGS